MSKVQSVPPRKSEVPKTAQKAMSSDDEDTSASDSESIDSQDDQDQLVVNRKYRPSTLPQSDIGVKLAVNGGRGDYKSAITYKDMMKDFRTELNQKPPQKEKVPEVAKMFGRREEKKKFVFSYVPPSPEKPLPSKIEEKVPYTSKPEVSADVEEDLVVRLKTQRQQQYETMAAAEKPHWATVQPTKPKDDAPQPAEIGGISR